MERNYTRQELQSKKISELKTLLDQRKLKTIGKKEELIQRILDDQAEIETNQSLKFDNPNYFSILPADIRNIIERYREQNENNNKILESILKRTEKWGKYISKNNIAILNKWFRNNNLNVELIQKSGKIHFEIGKLSIIGDKTLIECLNFILEKIAGVNVEEFNYLLEYYGSSLRIIKTLTSLTKSKFHTKIVYIQNF